MAELTQDPSNRELLDRMTRVESENAALTARVVELEKQAASTHNSFMRLAKQVGGVLDTIGSMDMELMGLLTKVFPSYFRTRQQITEVFNPTDTLGQQGKDRPD